VKEIFKGIFAIVAMVAVLPILAVMSVFVGIRFLADCVVVMLADFCNIIMLYFSPEA
jgi:hypothetical protein